MPPKPSAANDVQTLREPQTVERRGWPSKGLVALAISALGLAIAGSVAVTTSAETTRTAAGSGRAAQTALAATRPMPTPEPTSSSTQVQPSTAGDESLLPFTPAQTATDTAADLVRAAVVKERAAQRAEDLAKAAADATRLAQTAVSRVRSDNLAVTDRDSRQTAVRISTERRQRANAARLAAEIERIQAEAAARAATVAAEADDPESTAFGSEPSGDGTREFALLGRGFLPVPGGVIGTPFGATGLWARYHTGVDFRAAQGTPIRAVKSGVVLYAGNSGDWAGNHVAILHSGGITTMSSHLSTMAVHAGQSVRAGQVIGRVGQTGRAFGAHLHFEIYPRGVRYGDIYKAVNPLP